MYVKSLTLKGFKSFASATTMRFEPGITCVVGPNGSGKSNVLDAMRWVMGTQGAKDLRGGKMEDVIFAGTSGRPPLGRAEVSLTIDNADGALPIEYSEVSITRRMFRDGASEYEINGSTCRLLDVQELLSDSGIGREMHVIVGQGQLADILQAKPEERRAFIEEAAGVLKHRKRKEKARRKLDAMQANLDRVNDLTTELRRQLKPLGKQAEIARRAQTVQADLRDARLRLYADDLLTQRQAIEAEQADEQRIRQRRAEVEQQLEKVSAQQVQVEAELAADQPKQAAAADTWYKLSALGERLRGTVRLALERQRHLSTPVTAANGRDPEELLEEADQAQRREQTLTAAVDDARNRLAETVARREQLEQEAKAAEKAHLAAVRAIADRREGIAKLTGRIDALRSKIQTSETEIGRLTSEIDEAGVRAEQAARELEAAQTESTDADTADLADRVERAMRSNDAAKTRVAELAAAERAAEQEIAAQKARVDALSIGLSRKDGAGALLQGDELPVIGSVAALLTIEAGFETALAVALGPVADAIAVAHGDDAVKALEHLRTENAGRAGLLVAGNHDVPVVAAALPDGARWAVDVVQAPKKLRQAVARALANTAVVDTLQDAKALVTAHPQVRAVTRDGDVFGAHWAAGGSAAAESVLEVQAAVDEAEDAVIAAQRSLEKIAAELDGARAEQQARRDEVAQARETLNEAKVARARIVERADRLRQAEKSARAELDRLTGQRSKVDADRENALQELAELEERLSAIDAEPTDESLDTTARDEAAAALTDVRQKEVDARLALRTAEERARGVAGKADALRRAADAERKARDKAAQAALARKHGAEIAAAVVDGGEIALERIEVSLQRAAADRDALKEQTAEREQQLSQVRQQARELAGELEKLTDAVHRDEVMRAEQRLRLEQLEARIAEEFAIGLDDLIAEYGPDQPIPPSPDELAEYSEAKERGEDVVKPAPIPYDRPTQERRAKRAERDLKTLGKVNPLALEEFAALEERYKFLSTQLEDLKATRKDLLDVITEVDAKILELFESAYYDVAREFETVFTVLFPGGEGRMVLTDPDDMLATGIDIEARPPGKKVKRLSLLSGGEKSLVAVAMLVAIFRARPSPFYVLDEVEAALDDTNLRRLLSLLEQLRDSSQLIVITHQKPTMEIADALYGVSMAGDGITKVISQRLQAA